MWLKVEGFKELLKFWRQILDAPLIVNDVVDLKLRRNSGGFVCKLDIKKAYDHLCWVNWEFVLEVMRIMSFGHLSWVNWEFVLEVTRRMSFGQK